MINGGCNYVVLYYTQILMFISLLCVSVCVPAWGRVCFYKPFNLIPLCCICAVILSLVFVSSANETTTVIVLCITQFNFLITVNV